jgi:hypothetical protein
MGRHRTVIAAISGDAAGKVCNKHVQAASGDKVGRRKPPRLYSPRARAEQFFQILCIDFQGSSIKRRLQVMVTRRFHYRYLAIPMKTLGFRGGRRGYYQHRSLSPRCTGLYLPGQGGSAAAAMKTIARRFTEESGDYWLSKPGTTLH